MLSEFHNENKNKYMKEEKISNFIIYFKNDILKGIIILTLLHSK